MSDELWYRVQDVKREKASGGGRRRADRIDPLAGSLFCIDDGAKIGLDGFDGHGSWRRRHKHPCESWGPLVKGKRGPKRKERRKASTYSAPFEAAMSLINLDEATIRQVRAVSAIPALSDDLEERRIDRRMDEVVDQMRRGALDRLGAITQLDHSTESEG